MNLLIRDLTNKNEIPVNAMKYDFLEISFVATSIKNHYKMRCPNCSGIIDTIKLNQKICCHHCGHWIAWHESDIWTLYVWRDNVYERKPSHIQKIISKLKGLF